MLSNVAKKLVKDLTSEVSASMTRMEGERDLIREAIKGVADETENEAKVLRKLCKVYHQQNFNTSVADNEFFEETYQTIFETAKKI